ncbi:cupin domain-containing protein [bacterium]|nr:cupin domain-containing protein [bacterium]
MPFFDIDNHPEMQLFDGVKIRTAYGEKIMMSFVYFEPNSLVPEHSHTHEQMGMVMEGRFRLTVNGESKVVEKGDVYLVPSNAKHSAQALNDSAVALDIFSPPREDYKSNFSFQKKSLIKRKT